MYIMLLLAFVLAALWVTGGGEGSDIDWQAVSPSGLLGDPNKVGSGGREGGVC